MAERLALGFAWALSPKRIRGVPNLLRLCFDEFLAPDYALPDPRSGVDEPPGLPGSFMTVHQLDGRFSTRLYPCTCRPLEVVVAATRSVLFFSEFPIAKVSAGK